MADAFFVYICTTAYICLYFVFFIFNCLWRMGYYYIRKKEITAPILCISRRITPLVASPRGALRQCTILGPLPPLWPMHC